MPTPHLEDLRRSYPNDATLQNLLKVLSGQLELCACLPVYEYEAAHESYQESAEAFHALAIAEQAHIEGLLLALRQHLEAREQRFQAASHHRNGD